MYESSTSQGVQLGKRPASSPAPLEKRGKKRATEGEGESHGIIQLTVKSQVIHPFFWYKDMFTTMLLGLCYIDKFG